MSHPMKENRYECATCSVFNPHAAMDNIFHLGLRIAQEEAGNEVLKQLRSLQDALRMWAVQEESKELGAVIRIQQSLRAHNAIRAASATASSSSSSASAGAAAAIIQSHVRGGQYRMSQRCRQAAQQEELRSYELAKCTPAVVLAAVPSSSPGADLPAVDTLTSAAMSTSALAVAHTLVRWMEPVADHPPSVDINSLFKQVARKEREESRARGLEIRRQRDELAQQQQRAAEAYRQRQIAEAREQIQKWKTRR